MPIWHHIGAMNITIKDVPKELHHALRERAETHGRSLNKEVLALLEKTLSPSRISPQDLLEQIEARRNRLPDIVRDGELQAIIKEGR
jgi:plasmid stability protein